MMCFLENKVENLVAIELAYINTKHPDFHKDAAFVSSLLKEADDHLKDNKRLVPSSNTILLHDPVSNNRHFVVVSVRFIVFCMQVLQN